MREARRREGAGDQGRRAAEHEESARRAPSRRARDREGSAGAAAPVGLDLRRQLRDVRDGPDRRALAGPGRVPNLRDRHPFVAQPRRARRRGRPPRRRARRSRRAARDARRRSRDGRHRGHRAGGVSPSADARQWIVSCVLAWSWSTTGATKGGSYTFAPLAPTTRRGKSRIVNAAPRGASMRRHARRPSANASGIASSATSATPRPAPTACSAARAIPRSRARTSTRRRASPTSASANHARRNGSADVARGHVTERRVE